MTTPEQPAITGAVVPFGKYKGQPVEVLFADPGYREWILAQPWVKERFGNFHQVIINYGGEPQDSPEHNQMQASFLDDDRCNRLARLLWANRLWDARKAVTADARVVELVRRYPAHVTVEWHEAELAGRKFESDGWDVVFGYEPPEADVGMLTDNPIPCTCAPCGHVDCPPTASCQSGNRTYLCQHHSHEPRREAPFSSWQHCSGTCPYSDSMDCAWLSDARGHTYTAHWMGLVRVECKPDLGDDFPTVLRQVLRYPRDPLDRCCVIVRRHRFQHVTWQQVFDMFAASKIRLIQESELNPVRAIEAAQ